MTIVKNPKQWSVTQENVNQSEEDREVDQITYTFFFPKKWALRWKGNRTAFVSAKLTVTTQAAPSCANTLYDDELVDEMSAVKDTKC